MCASEMIEHRKNSWELYGFDYMIDDEYNAWLIEINSSPACDYSTKVTERYVQKALVELLAVTLDCREWESQPKKTRGERPNTGGWECIHQGPLVELPVGTFGTDMSLKGEPYKNLPRRSFAAPPVVQLTSTTSAVSAAAQPKSSSAPVQGQAKRVARGIKTSDRRDSSGSNELLAVQATLPAESKSSSANNTAPSTIEKDVVGFDDSDDEDSSRKRQRPVPYPPPEGGPSGRSSAFSSSKYTSETKLGSSNRSEKARGSSNPAGTAAIPVKVFSLDL